MGRPLPDANLTALSARLKKNLTERLPAQVPVVRSCGFRRLMSQNSGISGRTVAASPSSPYLLCLRRTPLTKRSSRAPDRATSQTAMTEQFQFGLDTFGDVTVGGDGQ